MLILLLVASVFSCTPVYQLNGSTCAFYLDYPTPNDCSSFSFYQCAYQQCTPNGKNRGQHCETYESSSWSKCTQTCCDATVSYPLSLDSLAQCQTYINGSGSKALAIGLSVSGAIVLVVSVAVLYCCIKRKGLQKIRDCCTACNPCCSKEEIEPVEDIIPVPEQSDKRTSFLLTPIADEDSKWRYPQLMLSKVGQSCSVCLDSSPSLQLRCGHAFHRPCILACLKRKEECILCRSTEISPVKVFCEKCFSGYFELSLPENMGLIQSASQVCPACKENTIL